MLECLVCMCMWACYCMWILLGNLFCGVLPFFCSFRLVYSHLIINVNFVRKSKIKGNRWYVSFSFSFYSPCSSLSPTACFHSQKASMDQGSIGANNVEAVPSPAGGARHRASSVCSPQLLSLKGSLLCQLGSEGGRSQRLMDTTNLWTCVELILLAHSVLYWRQHQNIMLFYVAAKE